MRLSQEAKVTSGNDLILIFEWQSIVPFIPTSLASYHRLFIRKCKTPSVERSRVTDSSGWNRLQPRVWYLRFKNHTQFKRNYQGWQRCQSTHIFIAVFPLLAPRSSPCCVLVSSVLSAVYSLQPLCYCLLAVKVISYLHQSINLRTPTKVLK